MTTTIKTEAADVAPEDQGIATAVPTVPDLSMAAPVTEPEAADVVPDEQDRATAAPTVPELRMAAPVIEPEAADVAPEDQGIATAVPTAPDVSKTAPIIESKAVDVVPDEQTSASVDLTAPEGRATTPTTEPEAADAAPDEKVIASVGPAPNLGITTAAIASRKTADRARNRRSVASASPTAPGSLQRKSRWKKRGKSVWKERLTVIGGLLLVLFAATALLRSGADATHAGPDTPFAKAVFEAFPEADPERIEGTYQDDLPIAATLHLPAHLIEPGQSIGNPFLQLGAQFGGTERTLSGVEMASRLERIGNTVLPADMVRCHTYEIGEVSSLTESSRRTRILRLRLNPGC